ncbi:mitogen-activated protein kinase kinase kinase 19-like [Sinocyclocheilus rhinocerous]|uniref:mitogen-activated protein kinase kinase kinase 19-like n=1 Tax=Sinocyclocheilus rhinocerous TaxID=307959 RepID=UPI0007B79C9E|nr:PREDICTED: mitogen-activated protein kinase kinase kinase 19-like [Sinocyclocheilus rhinocerous]
MSKHERSRFVEQLLKDELEAVALGLEQGVYAWEEIDLPHDSQGSTPLISACRTGLTRVMHFLLKRGADATLCNSSNQTALHVSQPALQGELLTAMIRDLPHRKQLSLAAWRGDLCCLQDLMAQADLLELNKQNRDGLTPLMLAVRDVDLFEGLETPWEYQPVEVVKELMSFPVDMKILDGRGHTALWYVSQIKTTKKEELIHIMDSSMQTETIFTCLDASYWPTSPSVLPSCSPTRGCCTPDSDGMKSVFGCVSADNRICFEGWMEPKIFIRQNGRDERKRSSRTSSLPSLWNNRKDWGKIRSLHPSLSLNSSSIPVLPAAHVTQLSKSAPMLMDPLLDASVLLQARTNIHNRLGGVHTGDDDSRQKTLPTLCSKSLKHLAPLDNIYRNGSACSSLEHPLLLKQSSILPISSQSRKRLERISRPSSRRSRGTRAASEESNSCSSSSQEEDETVPQDTHKIHVGLDKSLNLELGTYLDFQDFVSSVIHNTRKYITSDNKEGYTSIKSLTVREVEDEIRCKSTKTTENSEEFLRKSPTMDCCSVSEEPQSIIRQTQPIDRGTCFIAGEKHLATVDTDVVEQTSHEKNKPVKMIKIDDSKGKTSIQTNQSFNVLAHRKQSTVKTTRKRINSPIHSKVQLRESKPTSLVIAGECNNKYLPRAPCKKTAHEAPTARGVSEPFQHMKLSDDKKVSSKSQNQLHRDLRSAKASKKPVTGPVQRTRSAVDYVTYNDMFLKISQGDEGPAIYEMFATPVYENLRVDSSAERTRQVHTALQVKRQTNGKLKGQKTVEVNRRKQAQSERSSRAKCRQLKRRDNVTKGIKKNPPSSENKCHVLVTSACGAVQQNKSEMHIKGDGRELSSAERQRTSILSVIEEVLSNTASKTSLIKEIIYQEQTPIDAGAKSEPEISNETKLPSPLINTWTSDGTVSPVYHSFLDEVGDGPLTDDLLRFLAEELISLERRDVETLKTEKEDSTEFKNNVPSRFRIFLNEGSFSGELHYTNGSCSDDAITWTKGEVLGKGAYGTVYCGLTSQGQLIAVKQVALDASTSEMAEKEYERLEREVDLLKTLHHTNIVGFLGTALCENTVSIFMEYVPGGSISNILSRFGPLPEKVFVLYTRQILEGVAYLHANRVIHRDLKGNNIMLMPNGVVKLIDFGCARRLSCLQTSTGSKSDFLKSVHGTPYWMAPEVISETGHGRKSDIWSIGCTVYEMATGKPPLAHMNKMAALFYIGAQKGLMPSLTDDFSTHAKSFVKACLTRDPKQRPSAEELLRHPYISHHSQACNRPMN